MSDQPSSVDQIRALSWYLRMMSRTFATLFITAFALRPYGLMARVSNHFFAPALYMAGMNVFSFTPIRLSGMPALTISMLRSAAFTGLYDALSSAVYCLALGLPPQ